ncbi:MAG TPA: heavy metal-binding domain-containing protein [Streptosporangiaceae bacterium]|nr:heavy metal-binding domain-containing protein [Streptosporangiaceae bacterium]
MSDELPAVAEARMAEIRASGTWGSALTSDEFAAIRSVGFAPAGQVLGACVYNIGYTGGYACPSSWGGWGYGNVVPNQTKTQVSSRAGYGSFAPLVQAMYEARHKALDRMTAECEELGGHGVVGVRLTIGGFPAGGLEFKAIGTAVRAPGVGPVSTWPHHGSHRRRPFTSDLSGQDFAKLIMKGWVPAGLALGISIGSRHDDWLTVGQTRWGSGNAEVTGFTELVNDARHDARQQLERDVARLGGEGVVIADMQMRVRERECPVQEGRRDHIVEVTTIGTAIARFARSEQRHSGPTLAIMSLDPQRRQAARIRI